VTTKKLHLDERYFVRPSSVRISLSSCIRRQLPVGSITVDYENALATALAPGLPTVSASGLPGYEVGTLIALFAPAGTPAPIIRVLNKHFVQLLNSADLKEKLAATGVEVAPGSPEDLTATMKADIARFVVHLGQHRECNSFHEQHPRHDSIRQAQPRARRSRREPSISSR
jgi:hypothetical protein